MDRYSLASNDKPKINKEKLLTYRSNVQISTLSKSLSLAMKEKTLPVLEGEQKVEEIKLPALKLKKVLGKIGATSKKQSGFIPTQVEKNKFRREKIQQLKDLFPFSSKKRSKKPFKFQLDQIVLDCYQHGQSFGRQTIWRNYKKNIEALSLDTMRVLLKK